MKQRREAERDAYSWFFRAEYQGVLRTTYLIVGDRETARDLTQEAFARLYGHWGKVARYDRPEAWVRQVAVRLAIQHVRRKRIRPADLAQHEVHPEIDASLWDVHSAVKTLPVMQRAAILLFYFEDRPSREIAEILDCSENTIRVHLHRARKSLARLLEERATDHAS